jgi:hypothetical protein
MFRGEAFKRSVLTIQGSSMHPLGSFQGGR